MEPVKQKRRTRQKDDISDLKYTPDQLRIKLQRYCKKKSVALKSRTAAVGATMPKSTTISMREVSMIADVPRTKLHSFKSGKMEFCKAYLKRLIYAIDLIESGRVVKTQAGKYTIHDEPVVAPVREMRVSVFGGKILGGATTPKAESKMPSFDKLFG